MEKSTGCQDCELLAIAATAPTIRTFANHSQTLNFSEADRWGIKIGDCSSLSCHNGLTAIIDQKNDLWLLDRALAGPLNISELVRLKARRVFMGEGQLIFQSKRRGWILINWSGKIDLDPTKLSKLHIAHNIWSNAIDAYFLEEDCEQGSIWYFSSIKKLENTIKVYLLSPISQQIVGFAGRKTIKLKEKPSGMHLGKYHGLCWTTSGKLFSWGCKNLGMGLKHYQKSYYEEAQEIILKQSVFKAVAGINYSLALTSNGNLYEWGISHEGEPILTPRVLKMKQNKFVDLKAFDNFFAGLTSSNELLFWGKGKERYMPAGCKEIFDGVFALSKAKGIKIYDYNVEQNYLLMLISKDSGNISREEKHYFTQVVRKASQKFLPHRIKRQNSPFSSLRPQPNDQQLSFQLRRNEDYIDRLISTQVNKQQYFTMVQNQQAVFRKIMQEKSSRSISRVDSFISSKENIPHEVTKFSKTKILRCHRKVESARQTPNIALSIQSSNRLIRQFEMEQAQRRSKKKRCKMPSPPKRQKTDYGSRLQAVILKKQEIQQRKRQERLQVLKKKEEMVKKILHQNQEQSIIEAKKILAKLTKWFAKGSACSLLLSPLQLGRQLKIMQLSLAPPCDAITENMKNILLNSRAVNLIKSLQSVEPKKYDILAKVVVRGIQRWRAKKDKRHRADIVKQLIKFSLAARTRYALTPVWLAARKLQKVCKWISIQQKERSMQLKMVWKKALLLYLRPTPSFENKKPSICKEELNYKLCSQKIKNPRLNDFLLSSPIFKLKLLFPHPIEVVQDNHCDLNEVESVTQSSENLHFKKIVSWAQNQIISRKIIIVKDQQKSLNASSGPTDILLYSQHYDCFYKPKNYQINVPDSMKLSQKWIAEQRKILNRIIREILLQQWKQFYSDRAGYELRLAHFIKENYQTLIEMRWKFLIEYNKIKNEQGGVAKRERELWSLLRSIGAEGLLASDVMPQKHKIIQYAKQLKGAPIPPSLEVVLPSQEFKKQFKAYYEGVSNRAKYLRKFYN